MWSDQCHMRSWVINAVYHGWPSTQPGSLHTAVQRKYTQPCSLFSGARLCEQWEHGCVNNGARLCASARLCRGSPVCIFSWLFASSCLCSKNSGEITKIVTHIIMFNSTEYTCNGVLKCQPSVMILKHDFICQWQLHKDYSNSDICIQYISMRFAIAFTLWLIIRTNTSSGQKLSAEKSII